MSNKWVRDHDTLVAAKAFARGMKCQGCGRFDHTLRVVAFPYVVSILVVSFKRFAESGVFCYRCRCSKSIKWAIVSLLFGWWSLWGFFWTIGALIDNFRGGKMPRYYNKPLVARLAWAHMVLGKIAQAKAALNDLLKYGPNKEAIRLRKELGRKYPSVTPATIGGFRLGYLALVIAVLAIYGLIGYAIIGTEGGLYDKTEDSGYVYFNGAIEEGADGHWITLENNPDAVDPSWDQLKDFLSGDNTDEQVYSYGSFMCADFAEMLHNNAEVAGIRTAYVGVDFTGDAISGWSGHALNAFNTLDQGKLYVDSTGLFEWDTYPCSCDTLVDVEVGREYIPESIFPCHGWSSTCDSLGTVTQIHIQW